MISEILTIRYLKVKAKGSLQNEILTPNESINVVNIDNFVNSSPCQVPLKMSLFVLR